MSTNKQQPPARGREVAWPNKPPNLPPAVVTESTVRDGFVEVRFAEKNDAARDYMKAVLRFRWAPSNSCWFGSAARLGIDLTEPKVRDCGAGHIHPDVEGQRRMQAAEIDVDALERAAEVVMPNMPAMRATKGGQRQERFVPMQGTQTDAHALDAERAELEADGFVDEQREQEVRGEPWNSEGVDWTR